MHTHKIHNLRPLHAGRDAKQRNDKANYSPRRKKTNAALFADETLRPV